MLTPEGRERLRRAALANRPWEHSTGPRTAAGKATAAGNATRLQKGEKSVRQLRTELADVESMVRAMLESRRLASSGSRA